MIGISAVLIFIGAFMLGSLLTYQQFRYEWYQEGYIQGNKDGWKECEELRVSMITEKEQSK